MQTRLSTATLTLTAALSSLYVLCFTFHWVYYYFYKFTNLHSQCLSWQELVGYNEDEDEESDLLEKERRKAFLG